jgi:anti-sigma regulatory factor (Ser/Thr protein kinase)/PAS domain-containing protein
MNVAIVGGGDRCYTLLEFIEKHSFHEISVEVIAVAEEREDAAGLVLARERGLFVTSDYNDFFDREDIDLIVELTGNQETYFDILAKKDKTVRAIDRKTATLFWEFILSSRVESETKQELEEITNCYDLTLYMYDAIINELIHDDVMVISSNYSVIDINNCLLNKLGLKREEAIGRLCYEITHKRSHPCSGEEHPCPLHEVLSTGKPFQASHVHLDKGNKRLLFSISCYPLIDDGEVIGMVEMARDITEDIFQKVLMREDKMASIGRLAPAMKLTDVNNVIRGCVVLTRKQAAFNDVTVEENLAGNLPEINMDKAQIEQALINLALNAIEATGPGGKITINSRFASKADMVEITVSDTGKGISEEDVDRIFEPFYTTSESGTGLGLAITHGIIEQHGGTVEVESKMGQGTSFIIRLPLDNGENSDH